MVPPASAPLAVSSTAYSAMSSYVTPETSKLIAFLKEYKVLECSCCSMVFGFQHKSTGLLYCMGGCHERSPPTSPSSALALNSVPTILKANPFPPTPTRGEQQIKLVEQPKPEVSTAPPPSMKTDEVDAPLAKVNSLKPEVAVAKPVAATANKPLVATHAPSVPATASKAGVPKPAPTRSVAEASPASTTENNLKSPAIPNNHLWSAMTYSKSFTGQDAQVRVQFAWNAVTYTVVADSDEDALTDLAAKVAEYAATAKKLQTAPALDQIVIGEYGGDYYRARVTKRDGNLCKIVFIDYGDQKECDFSELFPVNDVLMKYPVYGLMVQLKLPVDGTGWKLTSTMEDMLYNESYILDMVKKNVTPVPGLAAHYEVRMWDLAKEYTLNEKLTEATTHCGTPITFNAEQDELAYFMKISSQFRELKELVEKMKQQESSNSNQSSKYVFKLDNADVSYKIQDLSLIRSDFVREDIHVEITRFNALNDIVAKPLGEPFDSIRNRISENIENWMKGRNASQTKMLQDDFIPEYDEMCIVQWPKWEAVNCIMNRIYGSKWMHEYMEDQSLDIFRADYKKHSGKWFRAACACTTRTGSPERSSNNEDILYRMFLVDLGKITLVPGSCVYRMPNRFMIDCQLSLFLSLHLDDIIQYDDKVDEKWKYLLLPGIKIKIKVLWMFEEINIFQLIKPTEKDFNEHFKKPETQDAIQRHTENIKVRQRHRKVKKMSTKGTFLQNMQKVLADEAKQEKLRQLKDKYSDIWMVHPDRIFELRLPDIGMKN